MDVLEEDNQRDFKSCLKIRTNMMLAKVIKLKLERSGPFNINTLALDNMNDLKRSKMSLCLLHLEQSSKDANDTSC